MRLLWLPDVLRSAGLTVHEVDGWRGRGADDWSPRGIVVHETRGSRTSTDAGEISVLLNGSPTAPPPIAQLYLSRTGDWHVIASGRCNHVKVGWAGPFKGVGNSGLLGIEAQHAAGEPWTDRQYKSYVRGVAAIRRRTGWGVAGHKEHQPGGYGHSSVKTDPSFDMNRFRRDVDALLAGGMDDVSAEDVVTGLRRGQDMMSEAVGRYAAEVARLGSAAPSTRLLTEYTWHQAHLIHNRDIPQILALLTEIRANQAAMLGKDWVNEQEIIDGVLAGLGTKDLDDAVAALRAAFGDRAAELAARLAAATGQG